MNYLDLCLERIKKSSLGVVLLGLMVIFLPSPTFAQETDDSQVVPPGSAGAELPQAATPAQQEGLGETKEPRRRVPGVVSVESTCVQKPESPSDNQRLAPWSNDSKGPRDWIQLNTGEWLAGRFLRMEKTALHFSSAKFDFIQFDWSDIHVLHLNPEARVVLSSDQVLVGHVRLISASLMYVDVPEASILIDPEAVVTILVDTPNEWSHWTLKTSAGFNLRRGNTTSADFTGDLALNRRDDFTRFLLQYNGAYGRVSEQTNTNKHLAQTRFDIILSSHSFLIPFFGSLRHDEFQNLNFRYALGAGAGVRPIDRRSFTFDVAVGVGYQQSIYITTLSTDSSRDSGLLVQPQFTFDWDITGDLELAGTWYSGVIATEVENTYHHGTLDFSIDLTPRFFLKLGSTFDRQESPRTDDAGVTPRKDDFAISFSLGLDLQ